MSVIEIEQRRRTPLTTWMGFYAGNVSDQNRAEEAHTTHSLDGISCRQCQQSKSSRGGAHHSRSGWDFMQAMSVIEIEQRRRTPLTDWMGIHAGYFSTENQLYNLLITSCSQYSDIGPLHRFNRYLISLRNRLSANFSKSLLSHLHTKNMC